MLPMGKNMFIIASYGFCVIVTVFFVLDLSSQNTIFLQCRPSKIASHVRDLQCHLTQKISKSIFTISKRPQLLILGRIPTVGLSTPKLNFQINRCLSTYCHTFPLSQSFALNGFLFFFYSIIDSPSPDVNTETNSSSVSATET